MSIDRKQIVRVDCPTCNGNGYVTRNGEQGPCARCGGVGMLESAQPYRAEGYTLEDAGQILGVERPTNRPDKDDPRSERIPGSDE